MGNIDNQIDLFAVEPRYKVRVKLTTWNLDVTVNIYLAAYESDAKLRNTKTHLNKAIELNKILHNELIVRHGRTSLYVDKFDANPTSYENKKFISRFTSVLDSISENCTIVSKIISLDGVLYDVTAKMFNYFNSLPSNN